MTPMSTQEIQAKLNDPYATLVLRPNAGGQGPWPATMADIVNAIATAPGTSPQLLQSSFMVGEGSQVPASVTPTSSNRDLRYVVAWGPSGQTPVIFLSGLPAGVQGGTPPMFLQVISYNPQNKLYNYYQYVDNGDVDGGPGGTKTWSWAGSGDLAFQSATAGEGCFQCHRNGGLNMKELTPPWNNWNSNQAQITAANVPPAVSQDPLFKNRASAQQLQGNFQAAMSNLRQGWIAASIQSGAVSSVGGLLAPLVVNTTVNFAASQTPSAGPGAVAGLPNDFFLADSVLRGPQLNLSYQVPALALDRTDYDRVLATNQFQLVNTDLQPRYSQPGATYFSFFVPVPAYEDVKAIQQLIQQQVVSAQFAAAAQMVDFQNPVFSQVRAKLLPYAQQITGGKADGKDIPSQFAALVSAAASGQPPCNPAQLSHCTAEQQFLFYWRAPNWQNAATGQIQPYLNAIGQRITTPQGVADYMALAVSRGVQFSHWPGICNLHEFSLLLPQTSLGDLFVQMNVDGTTSLQPPTSGCGVQAAAAPAGKASAASRPARGRRGHLRRARGGARRGWPAVH
jgi:hypothetical protein